MKEASSPEDPRVASAVAGSADALQEILGDEGPGIMAQLKIAPKWLRAIAPEDVLQVTFMEAFLRVRTLRDASRPSFRAWLKRIAQNNLNDAIRNLERDKRPDSHRRQTTGPDGESSRTLLARVTSGAGTVGSNLGAEEELSALLSAVAKLPTSYRLVIQGLDLDERSVADLAKEHGRSSGAIHMLHSRALDRLRDIMLRQDSSNGQ
ncbi:MAG: sigma-70 family RNA polymerase sigma factor [Planctomycetes bacterium]|nr:sigma-70 family RNA polymerase sigma factor [Planctomycetota bacterium]